MSTLRVNNLESYTPGNPLNVNDELQITGSSATGAKAFAHGLQTTAAGPYSHAEGFATYASGGYSHAEGRVTRANGELSHAEGYYTTASGNHSHAEGDFTYAQGGASHAEGYRTVASANSSHAEGQGTIADANYQHAQGKYNATGSGALMVIGNGTSTSNRNNLAEFHASKLVFDVNAFPTSSLGLSTGQLYRTGSSSDEIRIAL